MTQEQTTQDDIAILGANAKTAASELAQLTTEDKNRILQAMAQALNSERKAIMAANAQDLAAAQQAKLAPALCDRLLLNDERIDGMIAGFETVIGLDDPIGEVLTEINRPNGLLIQKVRVPIGVIAIIYESRPNVTADVTALCFKTANAVILRGGREAKHSNLAIATVLQQAGKSHGMPEHAVQLITSEDRNIVTELSRMDQAIDLIIPRGGPGLIEAVVANARVPVIKHYQGICHTYVDRNADINMAIAIAENAKCQRPGVCNAMETLLVHEDIAQPFLPKLQKVLAQHNTELRGCDKTRAILPDIAAATEQDWDTEYLANILAIKVVSSLEQAIQHINRHGSQHSDAIVSNDKQAQQQFSQQVQSATVYINASTRFTDGAEFGMGAEIGISTDKLHARGPMGLAELTTYQYKITGDGQIR